MMLYWHAVKAGLFRLLLQPRSSVPVVLSLALTLAALLTVAVLYRQLHLAPLPHITKPEQLSVHQVNLQMGKGDSWQWPALINDVTFGQALRQLRARFLQARALLAGRLRRRLLLRQQRFGSGDGACQRAFHLGHGLSMP